MLRVDIAEIFSGSEIIRLNCMYKIWREGANRSSSGKFSNWLSERSKYVRTRKKCEAEQERKADIRFPPRKREVSEGSAGKFDGIEVKELQVRLRVVREVREVREGGSVVSLL